MTTPDAAAVLPSLILVVFSRLRHQSAAIVVYMVFFLPIINGGCVPSEVFDEQFWKKPETNGHFEKDSHTDIRNAVNADVLKLKHQGSELNFRGSAVSTGVSQSLKSAFVNSKIDKKTNNKENYGNAAQRNVVTRFEILGRLLQASLISQEEYKQRRTANLGAILPRTGGVFAKGLGRPVPHFTDVVARMEAIAEAVETGSMNPLRHSRERLMILDALMPAKPLADLTEAGTGTNLASAAEDLSMFYAMGLISHGEYAAEGNAIKLELKKNQANRKLAPPTPQFSENGKAADIPIDFKVIDDDAISAANQKVETIELGSYRSSGQASRGWRELFRLHGQFLRNLSPEIRRANLGATGEVYYQLIAGPLDDRNAAAALCKKLRANGIFCQAG